MSVSYVASGGANVVTSSASLAHPAVVAAGDLLLIFASISERTEVAIPSATGYTILATFNGGSVSPPSAAAGRRRITVLYKVADGTEGGTSVTVTPTPSGSTTGRVMSAIVTQWAKTLGNAWNFTATSAEDATADTSTTLAGSANLQLTSGDHLVAAVAGLATADAESATATGVTFGAVTELRDSRSTINDDIYLGVWDFPVTSGSGSPVAPTVAATTSSATGQAALLVRLSDALDGGGSTDHTTSGSAIAPAIATATVTVTATTLSGAVANAGTSATTTHTVTTSGLANATATATAATAATVPTSGTANATATTTGATSQTVVTTGTAAATATASAVTSHTETAAEVHTTTGTATATATATATSTYTRTTTGRATANAGASSAITATRTITAAASALAGAIATHATTKGTVGSGQATATARASNATAKATDGTAVALATATAITLHINQPGTTPSARTHKVTAESRRTTVLAEIRRTTIAAEQRTTATAAENRTTTVPTENRATEVPA